MNSFCDHLLEYKGKILVKDGYTLQIYSDGINGNIKRTDNSVLCRFYIKQHKKEIQFSFEKCCFVKEFDYERYPVQCTTDLSEVEKIDHKNAKELCEVILKF